MKDEMNDADRAALWGTTDHPMFPVDAQVLKPLLPQNGVHLLDRMMRWTMVWRAWVASGPQGPIEDDGEPELS